MSKQTRKDQHVKPNGPEVEFFLSATPQYKKGETIPVRINGYEYGVKVGQRNTMPQEVVEVLQNAKSQTIVPDLDRYNPDKGGMPRRQEDFFNPQTKLEYVGDFDIEILNK